MLSHLLKIFHPHQVLETRSSQYSGQIQVIQEFGQPRIWAGGIPQTGGIVQSILKKHLTYMNNPNNLLLLGVGGGGILSEINKQFPECQITAVEIDPVMIDLAQKYFPLQRLTN